MRKIILFLICTFPFLPITAQRHPFTELNYDDGLKKASFYEVTNDPQGYMWLASDAALIRYDGTEFKYYTVRDGFSGNFVMDIDFDPRKQMWISTYGGGIARFDGNNFHAFNTTNGFPANYIRSITFANKGDMWVASEDIGVIRIEKGKKPVVRKDELNRQIMNPWSLIEDRQGNIWVAAIGGVGRFTKAKNYKYELMHSYTTTYTCLAEDKEGAIWASGAYSLIKIAGDSAVDYSYLLPPGIIAFDMTVGRNDSNLYIASADRLIIMKDNQLKYLDKSNGIKNTQFWDVYEDGENDFWLSSGGGGIVKCDDHGISIYEHYDDLRYGSMILDIVKDNQDRLIFGTELNGYFTFQNDSFGRLNYPGVNEIKTAYATVYNAEYNTTLLTSAVGAVYWMKNNKIIHAYQPDMQHAKLIYDIDFIDSNEVIIMSDLGCFTLKPGDKDLTPITSTPPGFYRSVFKDQLGRHWLLGDKGEVVLYSQGVAQNLQKTINPDHYNMLEGYHDAYHGLYWFCTNAGLIIWDGKNRLVLHSKNGLADMPGAITQDDEHRIWVGHDKGITCIDIENMAMKHIGYDQGFKTVTTNLRSLLYSNGYLWVGSVSELYKIDLTKLAPKNKHTRLRLQQVYFRDKIYFDENYFTDSLPTLSLKYNQNNLQFDLAALDFVNAAKVKYAWMLKGYDEDFMPYVYLSEVNYTNLEPGEYEFIAKAIDSDGFETNQIRMKINIEKPVWERLWFYLLEIGLFTTIVVMSFVFSGKSSNNRFGQIMTFLTIIIFFESLIFYLSNFINPLTNGIPVFQLGMNIILACVLQPMERLVKKWMGGLAIKQATNTR